MTQPTPPPPPPPVPTADAVASVLQRLTTPDTVQLRRAERDLNTLLASPASLTPLSQVLSSHPSPPLRHLSSVVLRRTLPHHWPALDAPARAAVKAALLPRLSAEADAAPRRGVIALLAAICRVEDALWPDLTAAAMALASAPAAPLRAAAFAVFHALCDAIPLKLAPHLHPVVPLLSAGLCDADMTVRLAALHAYDAAVGPASVQEGPVFDALAVLVPSVVAVAASHQDTRSDDFARAACAVFDVLTLVMEIPAAPNAKAYFQDAVRFALRVLHASDAAATARSAANEFIIGAVQSKPKTLRKAGLALQAVQTACQIVYDNAAFVGAPHMFGHDDDDPDEEEVAAILLALRLLDTLARRPELSRLVFAEVMSFVSRIFDTSANTHPPERDAALAAAYRIIGAVCQGCSVEVTAHAQEVVKRLVDGALDATATFPTRARAIEALGLACEALDTDEMPDDVTAEVANAALSAILHGMRDAELFVRKHACMSLEAVITLFEDDTAALRGRVAEVIQALGGLGADAAEAAVMAVGVLAEHATEAFSSSAMYKDVIEGIVRLMQQSAEKDQGARVAALEAAGALVTACKDQAVIERLASEAIACLDVEDPACKHATFSFFARMADSVGGSVVAVFGVQILTTAIHSMQREDVFFVPEDDEDEGRALGNGFGAQEEPEETGRGTYKVRTAYLYEKTVAAAVVGALASATATDTYIERISSSKAAGEEIRDLFSQSIKHVVELTSYFHEDVRAAAHRAYSRMAGANAVLQGRYPSLSFAGGEFAHQAFSSLVHGMREDDDVWVVTNVLGATSAFLALASPELLHQHKLELLEAIEMLIEGEAICQLTAEDDSADGDGVDEDVDGDEVGALIEAVGEVIEAIAHSLRGYFAQDFPKLVNKMLEKLYSKAGSPRNRGTVLGSVTAVLLFLNWDRCTAFPPPAKGSADFELAQAVTDDTAARLLPVALTAIRSTDSKTLQRNAVFLTGVIFSKARASRSDVWSLLPDALRLFQEILASRKGVDGALVDNAAGAVARIMIARGAPAGAMGNRSAMLQAVLSTVPLKDDPSENTTVARTLVAVAQSHFEDLVQEALLQSVVSSLVSAALIYREAEIVKARGIRHDVSDTDPNDRMTSLSKEEMWSVVSVLNRIRETKGDAVFSKLGLSSEDEVALRDILQVQSR